jgi:hypothetical protein
MAKWGDQFNCLSGHPSTWQAEVEALRRRVKNVEHDFENALKLLHQYADPFAMHSEDVRLWDDLQEKGLKNEPNETR